MWKIRSNSQNPLIRIFVIVEIVLMYTLYTTSQTEKVRTLSYDEKVDYGPKSLPRVWAYDAYDDGTVVLRVIRRNVTIQDQDSVCLIEKLFLRIIHLDGTIDEKDIDL